MITISDPTPISFSLLHISLKDNPYLQNTNDKNQEIKSERSDTVSGGSNKEHNFTATSCGGSSGG